MAPCRRTAVAAALFLAIGAGAGAQDPPGITGQASPGTVLWRTPTTVTVMVTVPPSATLIRNSVVLNRYDDTNRVVATLGAMYDDGSHGDAAANDSVFTTQIVVNEAAPSIVLLRASVAYRGTLRRVLSDLVLVPVVDNASASDARRDLAATLQAGDLTSAYAKLGERLNRSEVLAKLSPGDRQQLIGALKSCSIIETADAYEVCQAQVQERGQARTLHFVFVRDALGVWRILEW